MAFYFTCYRGVFNMPSFGYRHLLALSINVLVISALGLYAALCLLLVLTLNHVAQNISVNVNDALRKRVDVLEAKDYKETWICKEYTYNPKYATFNVLHKHVDALGE